jgi:hypothetical protein
MHWKILLMDNGRWMRLLWEMVANISYCGI